jgi:hypothetical protein
MAPVCESVKSVNHMRSNAVIFRYLKCAENFWNKITHNSIILCLYNMDFDDADFELLKRVEEN